MRKRAHDVLFWSLVAVSAAMLTGLVLVIGGVLPVGSPPDEPVDAEESVPAAREPLPATGRTLETRRRDSPRPGRQAPRPAVSTSSSATLVVVTATRGESWFSARLGSADGRVLDERVLARGESVRFRGERIWLAVGAAGNVDLTVNGKPRGIPSGTVELLLQRPPAAS